LILARRTVVLPWKEPGRSLSADALDGVVVAVQHSDGRALATALVTLYRDNASTLTPDPWHSAVHDSRPTVSERIRARKSTDKN